MIITSPGSDDKILACQYLNKGVQVDLLLHTGRLVDIEAISHKLGPHVCEEFVCGTCYDAMSVHHGNRKKHTKDFIIHDVELCE